ncbi:3-methyladenine DNA glycosylase [Paenarthrobacter sp. DKR-5]|uniref:DNA-3-methyladenine glycosylase family protein n=1 Tax=Paenarthrobacter sp. DKR-5 TaxID=2835535 RepID=UPI001BDD4CF9|nr:3-methyladenine DNA glycosylase [Paenarthrobacter sp. DKR-5]MBT1001166.1 3-methyladenine DNA glycosylase [Paenarthrobacter sp. DKR-5]
MTATAFPEADSALTGEFEGDYDLHGTVGVLRRGSADPAVRVTPEGCWFAFTTAAGTATLLLSENGSIIRARAWGPGAAAALDTVPGLIGQDDDWSGFDDAGFHATLPRMVTEARRRHRSVRLPATGRMFDAVVPAVLEQKVTNIEARRGWRYLVAKYGSPAPGPAPAGLRAIPTPAQWLRIPSWEWHRAGVGPQRSDTVMRAARLASGLERLAQAPCAEAAAKLQTVPGIGIWTAAEVTQRTHADPDSVSVGDYHLAAYVGWALIGKPVDDDGMLELLEPWRGHRQRVVRMIMLSGFRKPSFGPRMTIQDHRRH